MRTVAIVAALTVGCVANVAAPKPAVAPGLEYWVDVDPSMSANDVEGLIGAANDWTAKIPELRLHLSVSLCIEADHTICVSYADTDELQKMCGLPGSWPVNGCTKRDPSTDSSTIRLDRANAFFLPGWSVPLSWTTDRHEFGHAFGLQHTTTADIMFPNSTGQTFEVVALDVQQFWSLRRKP